jgi:hypothetical protein
MDRATFKLVMAIGVLLNSALYLSGCFIAGLATANAAAWVLALASCGVTYLSYICQLAGDAGSEDRLLATLGRWAPVLVWTSICLGFLAGMALLIGRL